MCPFALAKFVVDKRVIRFDALGSVVDDFVASEAS